MAGSPQIMRQQIQVPLFQRTRLFLGLILGLFVALPALKTLVYYRSQDELSDQIVRVARGLDSCEVPWMIDAGTLLGLIRDHGPIWGDIDYDIVVLEEPEKNRDCIQTALEKAGFSTKVTPLGSVKVYGPHGPYGDIDFSRFDPKRKVYASVTLPYCRGDYLEDPAHLEYCTVPKEMIFPLISLHLRGYPLSTPKKHLELVERKFGPNWRIPLQFDKGKNTTPLDTLKAKLWIVMSYFWVFKFAFLYCWAESKLLLLVATLWGLLQIQLFRGFLEEKFTSRFRGALSHR